jgi:hypothetical protein
MTDKTQFTALESLKLGARPEGRTLLTAQWVLGHIDGQHR